MNTDGGFHQKEIVKIKPFEHLINNGLGSIMTAHLFIPSLDETAKTLKFQNFQKKHICISFFFVYIFVPS